MQTKDNNSSKCLLSSTNITNTGGPGGDPCFLLQNPDNFIKTANRFGHEQTAELLRGFDRPRAFAANEQKDNSNRHKSKVVADSYLVLKSEVLNSP